MKRWLVVLCACLWSVMLLPIPAQAVPPVSVSRPQSTQHYSPEAVLKTIAQADVGYLGETHDRPADHTAQLAILQQLHLQRNLAIGLEMFQRPYQAALDDYLSGKITEAALQTQSQYSQRWGFEWEFYAPILRFAKAERIPLIALNTPTEITHKVAREGLESLTQDDRRFIPPQSEIVVGSERYRQRLRQLYDSIHQGKTSSHFDRFFEAQVLWDETMAEQIAKTRHQSNALVVVLVGQAHLFYGDGIPNRVKRRDRRVQQITVLLNPSEEVRTEPAIADYFWDAPAGSK